MLLTIQENSSELLHLEKISIVVMSGRYRHMILLPWVSKCDLEVKIVHLILVFPHSDRWSDYKNSEFPCITTNTHQIGPCGGWTHPTKPFHVISLSITSTLLPLPLNPEI